MPSPFPGMDPYLEHPDLWPDVHDGLIASLRDALAPIVRPSYYVALEERTYLDDSGELVLVGRADVTLAATGAVPPPRRSVSGTHTLEIELPVPLSVRETYLEVRAVPSGEVVTVIEVLSPANKRPGTGRALHLENRARVLSSRTSLVEIDLLRAGQPMPTVSPVTGSDYRLSVARGWRRPKAQFTMLSLRDPLPGVAVPLRPEEKEPVVALGQVLAGLYDRAGYDLRMDYRREPVPPLSAEDTAWAGELLASCGLRPSEL